VAQSVLDGTADSRGRKIDFAGEKCKLNLSIFTFSPLNHL